MLIFSLFFFFFVSNDPAASSLYTLSLHDALPISYGGIKMAEQACTTYGYQPSAELHKIFTEYTRTHNQAVFDAYTPEMKRARHSHIITGLPDTYGRGRIVGDYRRVALYGIDYLIESKKNDLANCGDGTMTDDVIRL